MELIVRQMMWALHWMERYIPYLNGIVAISLIFSRRKNPRAVWAWILALSFLPVLGLVLYLILGQDLYKSRMFRVKCRVDTQMAKEAKLPSIHSLPEAWEDLIVCNQEAGGFVYTDNNEVEVLTDGAVKFQRLIEEIDRAVSHIHLQYYIIRDDELFEVIVPHLVAKAQQGVEVRILCDGMGSRAFVRTAGKKLRKYGIRVGVFFPARFGVIPVRLNYRNHRKIAVIDGTVGFIGGFNVGREYVLCEKKYGYWRDTHLVLKGNAVTALQIRFALDWNYAVKENLFQNPRYFQDHPAQWTGHQGVQMIASGPDSPDLHIRDTYLNMIHRARKQILIQTPYFIPDEPMETALRIAAKSGVEVMILIPCKPDHPLVYWATFFYMGQMLRDGCRCFLYTGGFLHAKGMVVDGKICCYGSANFDNRSFSLNFESNAVVYDKKVSEQMRRIFLEDLKKSREMTRKDYDSRSRFIRLKEQMSRLIAPLL